MNIIAERDRINQYVVQFDMASFLNEQLLGCLKLFYCAPYSHVYMEEDKQHYLYFLVEGALHCSHHYADGTIAIFALSTPFTVIGDVEILSNQQIRSNVTASQQTWLLALSSEDVQQYGADDPRFLRFIIHQLQTKMGRASTIQTSHNLPVINRLAIYILSCCKDDSQAILPDKENLASLLGTTVRHLNRILNKLVADNIISPTYPLVRIIDFQALDQLAR